PGRGSAGSRSAAAPPAVPEPRTPAARPRPWLSCRSRDRRRASPTALTRTEETMPEPAVLPAFPAPLRHLNEPAAWRIEGDDTLVLSAGPRTDLFTDPGGQGRYANAHALLGRLDGDFTLSARITAEPAATYDAGVLLLYAGEDTWAKLCLELSPQGRPTIVSVVTRGVSDDCNSIPVDGADVRLRIARLGPAYAFHAA